MSLALGSCPTLQSALCSRYLGSKLMNLMPIALAAFIPNFNVFVKGENECKFFAYLYLTLSVTNHLVLSGVTLLLLYIMKKAK